MVCDNAFLVRKGLVETLSSLGFEVVAEAKNGHEAIELYKEHRPDVVLMDIRMPVMDGMVATKRICELDRQAKIIVLTWMDHKKNVVEATRNGAKGFYVHGQFNNAELKQAIEAVGAGGAAIAAGMTPALLEFVREGVFGMRNAYLSERETQMLELRQQGLVNIQIAEQMGVSEKTVRNSLSRLATKTLPRKLNPRRADTLTFREQDVAALLAKKRTVPQIALTLGISEKTVRNNVSEILSKLGLSKKIDLEAFDLGGPQINYREVQLAPHKAKDVDKS